MMYNVVSIEGIPCTSTFIIIISRCPVGPSVFIVKLIFFDDECDVNFLNKITRFFTWSLKKSVGAIFFHLNHGTCLGDNRMFDTPCFRRRLCLVVCFINLIFRSQFSFCTLKSIHYDWYDEDDPYGAPSIPPFIYLVIPCVILFVQFELRPISLGLYL